MKKKIFGIALIAIMALAAGWNFTQSKNEVKLSELALANVEALAQGEDSSGFKSGYEASSYQYYCSLVNAWTTIPCCKKNDNPYSGCSAIDTCP